MIEFAEAVNIAEHYVRPRLAWPEWSRSILNEIVGAEGHPDQLRIIRECIDDASGDPSAWDALQFAITAMLKDGNLPPELLEWLIEERQGAHPKPAKQGRPSNSHRDTVIWWAVVMLVDDYGMKPTRDATRSTNPDAECGSACDAVGLALHRCPKFPLLTYQSIEKIWRRGGGIPALINT